MVINKQYIIHLHDGDTIHIGGTPYMVMGDWEVIGNTKPSEDLELDFEEVEPEELA